MVLIAKKKKTRKPVAILNMGRRLKGLLKPAHNCVIFSNEEDNQKEDNKSVKAEGKSNLGSGKIPEDEDYFDE